LSASHECRSRSDGSFIADPQPWPTDEGSWLGYKGQSVDDPRTSLVAPLPFADER
jgi:hypothetical protein